MTEKQQIYEAMASIMGEVKAISKDRKNQQQHYKFRGIDDVYNELHPLLAKHKVFCTSEVLDFTKEERTNKSGGVNFYVYNKVRFTFRAVDGSSVSTMSTGEAMDSGDKASNKAMSAAHKVALIQTFMIPTGEDNDTENHSPEVKPKKQKATVNGVTKLFNERIKPKAEANETYPTQQEFIDKISERYEVTAPVIETITVLYNEIMEVK